MTMKTLLGLFFCFSCVFAGQEAAPVLVENEPLHHVVLKNESIVVLHLTLPPGEGAPSEAQPGNISVYTLAGSSFTHRVHNIGLAPFDVLDVELLARPGTPS